MALVEFNGDSCWSHYKAPEPLGMISEVIGTLVAIGEDRSLEVLGNAFVIYAAGRGATCLAAAHSFTEVAERQRRRKGQSLLGIPDVLQPKGPHYMDSEGLFAIFLGAEGPFQCRIEQQNYIHGHDVASFVAVAPEGAEPFRNRIGLDLRMPRIGDRIGTISSTPCLEPLEPGVSRLGLQYHMRSGFVTEVNWQGGRYPMARHVFETTMPVLGGMSGSPVFYMPESETDPLAVCGVVSLDCSSPEAFDDCDVAGCSTMSMLWPAMALGTVVSLEAQPPQPYLLGELLLHGAFNDLTPKDLKVTTMRGEMTRIRYEESGKGGEKNELSVTKYPLI